MDKKELLPAGLAYIADNIISRQNILGVSKERSARWAKGLNLPSSGETIFFAGCGYQYAGELESLSSLIRKMDKSIIGAELPIRLAGFQKKAGLGLDGLFTQLSGKNDADSEPLMAAVQVLHKLGIEFGYLAGDEPCCGAPLHHIGLQKEFAGNAEAGYNMLKNRGVKQIIGIVPSCTYTLRNLFPRYVRGDDIKVKHFTEVILENIGSRQLRFPREVKITYHDPCMLGRYMGIIEAPRKILRQIQGLTLIEPEWTKGNFATCCGGGGGFEAVFPELSQVLAVNRVRELLATSAEMIVTHCPGCILQLRAGLKELNNTSVEVLDLAQVLGLAMEA